MCPIAAIRAEGIGAEAPPIKALSPSRAPPPSPPSHPLRPAPG
ncbi:DUF6053 domain-containing protein [Lysobacter enzymogenes]